MRIDEHVLAGYLAGELSESKRLAVTKELIRDRNLREWLHLAAEALAAAGEENSKGPQLRLLEAVHSTSPKRMSADRDSVPSPANIRRAI
ncbi:MAG: hypothetical protein HKN13_09810 [Rhodothermales bacterium]|nr:hypothetical protein [Rhodothermales bacterium]